MEIGTRRTHDGEGIIFTYGSYIIGKIFQKVFRTFIYFGRYSDFFRFDKETRRFIPNKEISENYPIIKE